VKDPFIKTYMHNSLGYGSTVEFKVPVVIFNGQVAKELKGNLVLQDIIYKVGIKNIGGGEINSIFILNTVNCLHNSWRRRRLGILIIIKRIVSYCFPVIIKILMSLITLSLNKKLIRRS